MSISLFYPFKGAPCGTFTSIVDTYFNLRKFGYKPKLKLLVDKKDYLFLLKFIKNYIGENIVEIIDKDDIINDDIIIMSISSQRYFEKNKNIFNCNKLIYLDSGRFARIYFETFNKKDLKLNEYPQGKKETIFFCNPHNQQFVDNSICYFHKFSYERLNHIKPKKLNDMILDVDRYDIIKNQKNKNFNIFPLEYNAYNYHRHYLYGNTFYENIGKLIFEFNYHNKNVFYSPKNKMIDDGLTHYLNLFNINDNEKQILNISKNEMEHKLFMNKNDELLQVL